MKRNSPAQRGVRQAKPMPASPSCLRRPVHLLAFLALLAVPLQAKPRARDVGIPFDGTPGPRNAITDVAGVEVGQTTLIAGEGALVPGKGPVRTGVTVVLPRGKASSDPVFAGWYALNGNGEMTGTTWLQEGGFLEGAVLITNTHSVGTVRDASVAWPTPGPPIRKAWPISSPSRHAAERPSRSAFRSHGRCHGGGDRQCDDRRRDDERRGRQYRLCVTPRPAAGDSEEVQSAPSLRGVE